MTGAEPAPGRQRGLLDRARDIADTVLFPAALDVDAGPRVPSGHLDLLAREGFYGLAVPAEAGGAGADYPTLCLIAEALASGCLTTAFVWIQHQGAVRRVAGGPAGLRESRLGPLGRGERRAGVALGGTQPGPARLRARRVSGGYLLDGHCPWVTGWGMIDTLAVAARDERDVVPARVRLQAADQGRVAGPADNGGHRPLTVPGIWPRRVQKIPRSSPPSTATVRPVR
jgi:alkylation response protein AidB-like acyl-CoA dehydrogenase